MTLAVSDPTRIIDGFQDKTFLVIGDLMVDRYVRSQGRKLSREAPVPVADFVSEVLVLGAMLPDGGVVLLQPERSVENGRHIA